MSTPKKVISGVVILALLGTGALALNRGYISFGGGKSAPTASVTPRGNQQDKNSKPVAKFSLNNNKVFVGDEIEFLNQSTDPDMKDSVKEYSWLIMKDDKQILTSAEQSIKYRFDKPGNYSVSLVVLDSEGKSSDAYICSLQVLAKQEIPAKVGSAADNKNDRK